MILIVGASGRLGSLVARQALERGVPVRAMSRTPAKLEALRAAGVEVVAGDLRDPASLARACAGVEKVMSAAHAFDGTGGNTPRTVDDLGGRSLIAAASAAGVRHMVMMSIHGAHMDHPIDLFRAKAETEQTLRSSGLGYTILRPTAFMELWLDIIATPMLKQGQAMIFGRGVNPINFVSVQDVARFARIGLDDPQARGETIELGGPENLSLMDVVQMIERVTGRVVSKRHIPLPAMRAMALLARPLNPAFTRQSAAGVMMDTQDMRFDPAPTLARYPGELRRMEDVARERFAALTRI